MEKAKKSNDVFTANKQNLTLKSESQIVPLIKWMRKCQAGK